MKYSEYHKARISLTLANTRPQKPIQLCLQIMLHLQEITNFEIKSPCVWTGCYLHDRFQIRLCNLQMFRKVGTCIDQLCLERHQLRDNVRFQFQMAFVVGRAQVNCSVVFTLSFFMHCYLAYVLKRISFQSNKTRLKLKVRTLR